MWRIFGVPESTVDERMRPALRSASDGVTWGILAQEGVVDIKATVAGRSTEASKRLDAIDRLLRDIFREEIFGMGREGLEDVVGGLLKRRGCWPSV